MNKKELPPELQEDVNRLVQQAESGLDDIFYVPAAIAEVYQELDLPAEVKQRIAKSILLRDQIAETLEAVGLVVLNGSRIPAHYRILRVRFKDKRDDKTRYTVTMSPSVADQRPAVIAALAERGGRYHLANVQVDEKQRRAGLGKTAVSIIASCFPGVWWTAATNAGRALSQSLVSKGLARSIGFDSPMGRLRTECFEYILQAEPFKLGESFWTNPVPPEQAQALVQDWVRSSGS